MYKILVGTHEETCRRDNIKTNRRERACEVQIRSNPLRTDPSGGLLWVHNKYLSSIEIRILLDHLIGYQLLKEYSVPYEYLKYTMVTSKKKFKTLYWIKALFVTRQYEADTHRYGLSC
jgi:hypothetical protein